MSYINDTLMKNEVVLYRTKPHWIVFMQPIFWFLITVFLFIFGPYLRFLNFRMQAVLPPYAMLALFTLVLMVIPYSDV